MKGLSIALRVIAILGAAAAAFFWYQTRGVVQEKTEQITALEGEKADIADLNKQLTAEKEGLKGQVNQKELELSEAKSQVRFSSDQVSKLKRDLGKLERDFGDKQEELVALNKEHEGLKAELKNLITTYQTGDKADPEQLKQYKADIDRLEEDKNELKDKIAVLEKRLQDAQAGVPTTGPTAVAENGSGSVGPVPEQDASVLRTDPDRGILIISRGQADGLQQQMQFNIAKGLGKKVRVKVGTVTPTYSVAYVLPGEDPSYIQQGDSVRITQ